MVLKRYMIAAVALAATLGVVGSIDAKPRRSAHVTKVGELSFAGSMTTTHDEKGIMRINYTISIRNDVDLVMSWHEHFVSEADARETDASFTQIGKLADLEIVSQDPHRVLVQCHENSTCMMQYHTETPAKKYAQADVRLLSNDADALSAVYQKLCPLTWCKD
jgi:hypothetical protein